MELVRYRVLVASIRDKGRCPCPRCLIPLEQVEKLGTVQDMKQRKSLARADNQAKRLKVADAREYIYDKNFAVDSDYVEDLLKNESLVPTDVSA